VAAVADVAAHTCAAKPRAVTCLFLLCCSEFAAEFPLAGGAYNYISMSLGELPAWLVVTTLILEYILAAAAVSRAFSACEFQLLCSLHQQ
jgi:amino acid transporter